MLRVTADGLGAANSVRLQFTVYKRLVENQLCPVIPDLCLPPALDLALHRLEIALNPDHAHGQRVDQSWGFYCALANTGVNALGTM